MKIRNRTINIILAWIATVILRVLFLTVRVDHRSVHPDGSPYVRPKQKRRFAFCLWHDDIALAVFSHRTYHLSGLISQHRDGGYLADAAKLCGILPIRGSASRGGAEAIAQLLERDDLHLAMTPDGPRGPRRKMKEGIVYISSRSDRPLVPTALTADRFWTIRGTWTDLRIPKPFARVLLVAGRPMEIPADLSREDLPQYTGLVQAEMDRLTDIIERLNAGDESADQEIDVDWLAPLKTEAARSASGKAA